MLNLKDRTLLIIVFSCIGTPFFIGGIIISLFVPSSMEKARKEIETLPLVTAKRLENDIDIKQKVLVEGVISKDNIVKEGTPFVAYQEYNLWIDSDGDKTWKKGSTFNPQLLILAQDGLVKIEAGYEIIKSTRSIHIGTRKDKSYAGFSLLDPVVVKGIVTNKKEITQIKAEEVAAGTRDEYLKDFGKNATIFRFMGIGFILIGAIFDVVALIILVRPFFSKKKII